MRELVRTNDVVLVSFVTAILQNAGIEAIVLDQHMSIMEGSVGMLPRRVAVAADDYAKARQELIGAELGQWIATDG